ALHELSHQFFTTRTIGSHIRDHLKTNDDATGFLTGVYLNEGLATALGNGLYSRAIGSDDPQWYARDTINRYGHALLPLARQWIDRHRAIDREFFLAAHAAFQKLFPRYEQRWEFAFSRIAWMGSAEEAVFFTEGLKKHLPSYRLVEPSDDGRPLARVFKISSGRDLTKLPLSDRLRSRALVFSHSCENFILSDFDRDRDQFEIVFCSSKPEKFAALLERAFQLVYRSRFVTLSNH
ncbi:MAG TPA: hypothetical protein PKO06_00705, partial [Candidatus Ozemobacteraceae bacterium]|nr:hypothetical protein [Candidatus Ozemobacteraceae bacterium]